MSIYLGIDSGTQSTKAVALDLAKGEVIATARAPHRLIAGLLPGHLEQHPQDWARALEKTLAQVCAKIDRSRVRGIGVSGQQHGFVPLDADGAVIRPAKLWCDTSTTAECAWLTRQLGGPAAVLREIGLPFLPGYTAPKILWLKRHEPQNFRRLRHVLLPHDYLNFHLTGNYFMEHGDASGSALMDVRRRRWSEKVARAIDRRLLDCLPPLSDSRAAAGTLRPALAKRLGLSPDVLVSAGGGDNMMGAIGTGNVAPGVVTASLGTSGTIYATSARPVVDPRGEIAAFCSSTGAWLPLLCTMNVTVVTEQFRRLFKFTHNGLERSLGATSTGADGLLLLPYFNGERTPNLPHASGVLYGLRPANTTREHLMRAAVEGVTLGLNHGLLRLRALGIRPREIRLTGGGARSAAWRQVCADAFGVPVVKTVEDEAAALGGALQAAWASNPTAELGELCRRTVRLDETARHEPRSRSTRTYAALQEKHDSLCSILQPAWR
jgi:xylulokinase